MSLLVFAFVLLFLCGKLLNAGMKALWTNDTMKIPYSLLIPYTVDSRYLELLSRLQNCLRYGEFELPSSCLPQLFAKGTKPFVRDTKKSEIPSIWHSESQLYLNFAIEKSCDAWCI